MPSAPRIGFAAIAIAAAAMTASDTGAVADDDSRLRADLRAIAQRRVFFGHQSVGLSIMEGLKTLAAQQGVALRIVDTRPPSGVPAGTFGHGFVAANGNPRMKLQSFREAFDSGAAAGAEIALLKFCYVDFRSDTDAPALFAEYQATIAQLKARNPRTTFVHVTAPLMAIPGGAKQSLKQLLGRPSPRAPENARRDEYNALLRGAYQGREPVFDIARVQSTRPDGAAEAEEWQGRPVPALVPAYTNDGGHLNQEGQVRAARELIAVLAGIPPGVRSAGGAAR